MGYGSNGSIRTTGTVGGDGVGQLTKLKAGTNITLTSAGTEITVAATSGGGSGNTLDNAYDQGGAGSGRTISVTDGAVHLNSPASTGTLPLKITSANSQNFVEGHDGSSNKFVVSNTGIVRASTVQLTFTSSGKANNEASAVDLQTVNADAEMCAQAGASALIGGEDNIIGTVGSSGQVFATHTIIAGGQANEISSYQGPFHANHSAILAGKSSKVSNDATLQGTRGGHAVAPEVSMVLGSETGTVLNAGHSAVISSQNSQVDTHSSAIIVGGGNNAIKIGNSGLSAGRNNHIFGGRSNSIEATLTDAYDPTDSTTHLGQDNTILGGVSNEITGKATGCTLIGSNARATTGDIQAVYIGGDNTAATRTDNVFSFIGKSGTGSTAKGNAFADVAFNGSGADFAEMFEWSDGNPNGEDRVGLFAQLTTSANGLPNGKIEVGGDGLIVGPVSAMPGSTVNTAALGWQGRYLRDDFGRFVLDSAGERTLNPNYDEDMDYTSRGGRNEWSPIGLKGRVRVRASSNIGIYPSSKSGLTVDVASDGTVIDAGSKGTYKVIQVVKQKEIRSGPEGIFRRRNLVQDHGYGVVEILVE